MKLGLIARRRLSPIAALSRFLVGRSSPTASLYFENACANWLSEGVIEKISPTVFASSKTQVIFRHDIGVPIGFSRPNTVFFIDDDWTVDAGLPPKYRVKFNLVEKRAVRYFMSRSQVIGVSSERLRMRALHDFPNTNTLVLHPFWSEPLADLNHFDVPTLDACFLGAPSHKRDLTLVIPAIIEFLNRFPNAYFTLSAQHKLPVALAQHPRLKRFPAMGWDAYRRYLAKQRFHIALYPLQATEFNKARSVNKLNEHAIIGAASLCSASWRPRSDRYFSVENSPKEWTKALCDLAANPQKLRDVAQANKNAITQSDTASQQRDAWRNLLF